MTEPILLVLKFRLRDKHATKLNRQARAVNYVWNYCNEMQQKAARSGRKWLSWNDLCRLTAGASKELDLHAHTIQKVCQQYDRSRREHKKPWLRFRGQKSLGWVPFNQGTVTFDGSAFRFRRTRYQPMHLRSDIPVKAVIRSGSFNADSRGRWYINIPVEFPADAFDKSGITAVGIDLGIKQLATLSTGEKIEAPHFYRRLEAKLRNAYRANKKRLVRTVSAKIRNQRHDYLHKATSRIALVHGIIFVGNVSSSRMARTKFAKSTLDAGWFSLRKMLSYKAMRHGGRMIEVDERLTSQVCSACGALPEGRPKGIADIGIRRWQCGECAAIHDRDVNAAANIVRRGLATLVEGAPS